MRSGTARGQARWTLVALGLAFAVTISSGCHRAYYRRQADAQVDCLVDSGSRDPRWQLEDYTIATAPASRLFDPACPDHPPMPPDDPTAHCLMHCVDGKKGYPCWHMNGDAPGVENNSWLACLPRNERGEVQVDLEGAVLLGRVHSRNYQQQLEELYLSALDVTFERFRLDAQFFGGNDTFFTVDDRGPGGQQRSLLNTDTNLSMNLLLPAGGELMAGVANSFLWQFWGKDSFADSTILSFSFLQPLLRAGGRDVVLERLTLSERTLLANIRAMVQYRKAFYVNIAIGRDVGQGPSRRGGLQGGAGLEGFSGVGAGGFGRIGAAITGTATGSGFGGGAGAAAAGGFLGLLQSKRQIENQEANVVALRETRDRLAALHDAQRVNLLQAVQAEQALADAQSRLLTSQAAYETTLDNFKINLGLPPCLSLDIQDDMLDQFELLHPDLTAFPKRVEGAIQQLMPLPAGSRDRERYIEALERCRDLLAGFDDAWLDPAQGDVKVVAGAIDQLTQALDGRRRQLRRLTEIEAARQKAAQPGTSDTDAKKRAQEDLDRRLHGLQEHYDKIVDSFVKPREMLTLDERPAAAEPDEPDPVPLMRARLVEPVDEALRRLEHPPVHVDLPEGRAPTADEQALLDEEEKFYDELDNVFNGVWELLHVLEDQASKLQLIYARARLESIVLAPTDLNSCTALDVASQNRLDWMNARAALVDSWRLIEFNADSLESDLDFRIEGDLNSNSLTGKREESGRLRMGFEFKAPSARLRERNIYRQALIEYQQARRNYLLFVDRVSQVLRSTIRTMELNQTNFEIRRQAVWTAIDQVDQAQLRLYEEPPAVGASIAAGADTLGPTAARDLLSALSDLLSSQNDFLSVWVNYELQRMQLDLDLGTMQLDDRGLWIDPGTVGAGFADGTAAGCETDGQQGSETILPGLEGESPAADGELRLDVPQPELHEASEPLPPPDDEPSAEESRRSLHAPRKLAGTVQPASAEESQPQPPVIATFRLESPSESRPSERAPSRRTWQPARRAAQPR